MKGNTEMILLIKKQRIQDSRERNRLKGSSGKDGIVSDSTMSVPNSIKRLKQRILHPFGD